MKKFALFLGLLSSLYVTQLIAANNICENLFTPVDSRGILKKIVDTKGLSLLAVDPPRKPDLTFAGGIVRKNDFRRRYKFTPIKAMSEMFYDLPSQYLTNKFVGVPKVPSRLAKAFATTLISTSLLWGYFTFNPNAVEFRQDQQFVQQHESSILTELDTDFKYRLLKAEHAQKSLSDIDAANWIFEYERQDKVYFEKVKSFSPQFDFDEQKILLNHHIFAHLKDILDVGAIPTANLRVPPEVAHAPTPEQVQKLFQANHIYMKNDKAIADFFVDFFNLYDANQSLPAFSDQEFSSILQQRLKDKKITPIQAKLALQEREFWSLKLAEASILGAIYLVDGEPVDIDDIEAGILRDY